MKTTIKLLIAVLWIIAFLGGICMGILSFLIMIISYINYLVKDEPFAWYSVWLFAVSSFSAITSTILIALLRSKKNDSGKDTRSGTKYVSDKDKVLSDWEKRMREKQHKTDI